MARKVIVTCALTGSGDSTHIDPAVPVWSGFGIARDQFRMVAQAVLLGGHVRVGLEDNLYLDRGVLAPGNAALVERAVHIVRTLGEEVATPGEACTLLGLRAA